MVKLDLSYKGLTEVPEIPNDVTELYLSDNQIRELKEEVFPAGLQVLHLGRNKIVELKAGVFDYKPMVKPRLSDDEFKDKLHFNVLVYDNLNNVYNDELHHLLLRDFNLNTDKLPEIKNVGENYYEIC